MNIAFGRADEKVHTTWLELALTLTRISGYIVETVHMVDPSMCNMLMIDVLRPLLCTP